jgi:8-oxo-dGTP pyrophosphatase MutT (NUDIX family)
MSRRNGGLETKKLVSAGGVIFRASDGDFEVALCLKKRGKVWCLPKGLVEKNEKAEDAALREVREETGLEGEIVEKIGEINFDFFGRQHYFKTVHFYLLRYVGGSPSDHDFEVDDARWFSISDAVRILGYENERNVMRRARELLERRGLG